jgi:hypothetical protein
MATAGLLGVGGERDTATLLDLGHRAYCPSG